MLPLVSVIIPLYNHERYVERCLESIVKDGYPNIELLIIDDGSKDRSYEIAQEWCTKNRDKFSDIRIVQQENKGIANTLNRLVILANGMYISPIASDDCLLIGGIEARVQFLENNPNLLSVFGDCLVIDEMDNVLSCSGVSEFYDLGARKLALQNHKLIALELTLRWSVPGPIFLARKSTYDIVGYYDETLTVEDRDFFLRLLTKNALGFVDYKVACYRWHSDNLVKNPIGNSLRKNALKIAALKASREAKGLFKIALLVDYYHHRKSILFRIAWRLLMGIQTFRIALYKLGNI